MCSSDLGQGGMGNVTVEANGSVSDKSKVAAVLLCFFLGTLGIHRFYLGRAASGAVMLVLTIIGWLTSAILIGAVPLFVVGIWNIVDFFRLLFNGLKDGQGRDLS